jgi:hypothetical protein
VSAIGGVYEGSAACWSLARDSVSCCPCQERPTTPKPSHHCLVAVSVWSPITARPARGTVPSRWPGAAPGERRTAAATRSRPARATGPRRSRAIVRPSSVAAGHPVGCRGAGRHGRPTTPPHRRRLSIIGYSESTPRSRKLSPTAMLWSRTRGIGFLCSRWTARPRPSALPHNQPHPTIKDQRDPLLRNLQAGETERDPGRGGVGALHRTRPSPLPTVDGMATQPLAGRHGRARPGRERDGPLCCSV